MTWASAKVIRLHENASSSFLPNSLTADGRGRFAFADHNTVQCIRKSEKQGRSDFTLGKKSDGLVTTVHFWKNVQRFPRPLLAVATESICGPSNGGARLELWDTRNGRGVQVAALGFAHERGDTCIYSIANAVNNESRPLLLVGSGTGDVLAYELVRRSKLQRTCILRGLHSPVHCIAGDCSGLPTVAAAEEDGKVIVWMNQASLWQNVYEFQDEQDYCVAVGLKNRVLVTGHSSGQVIFHEIVRKRQILHVTTNAKAVTSLDVHSRLDLVVVSGEDGRIVILNMPNENRKEPTAIFSVCLDTPVVGCRFTGSRPDKPDISILPWNKSCFVRYDHIDDDP